MSASLTMPVSPGPASRNYDATDASALVGRLSELEIAAREDARLAALDNYDVLDTPREDSFDRITRLVEKVFRVPMAAISMVDGHRQWIKSHRGLTASELPRAETVCNATIGKDGPLIVNDLREDPRFAHVPSVTGEPGVRFYAGTALRTPDGHNIGTLCALDTQPREFSEEECALLSDLAHLVMDEMELRLQANRDGLTGALTRRAFKEQAGQAISLTLRHHEELSLVAFDLDHFKSVNDTYGHPTGDRVLMAAARACAGTLRSTDLIGRLGGEEFAVVLPRTGLRGATEVAEKIRAAIAATDIEVGGRTIHVTASLGVAALDILTRDLDTLLAHADEGVYKAKDCGRNRVVAWSAPAAATAATPRRRVLKGGQVVFNGGTSSINCTVRTLSDEGAGIDVSSTVGIPRTFVLTIKADGFEREARVVSQTDRHLEVAFS